MRTLVVGTERGLLYILAVLQSADARPTRQVRVGLERLEKISAEIQARREQSR